ncbi:hypothetical protein PLICRDRAFT_29570 [Plicaturopsis crispa FD-325 SS-3]|nr:hypothetical protein PLICRDRAFT_29570 [Plicaturopsis crispa FD-325 SS-3]
MFSLAAITALLALAAIPPSRGAQIDVTVGGPGVLKYDPEFVNANVGDTVVFTFKQKNHTATQSSLASPCSQVQGGFDSGFVPVADNSTGPFPVAQFTVQDTKPVWVYCKQTGHCQQGMVFAINPGNNFAQFQATATGNNSTSNSTTSSTSTATASSSASTPSSTSTDHFVTVGADGALAYSPANITAQPGDTVTFQFHQKNHTVTQSSFAAPCSPLSSSASASSFDSGFMPVAANASTFPTWTIQINDTKPVWAYCKQAGHCAQGMVFSVNADESGNSFEKFQAAAKATNASSAAAGAAKSGASTMAGSIGVGRVAVLALALAGGLLL